MGARMCCRWGKPPRFSARIAVMIIQSINRADEVLSLFSQSHPEWSSVEIASALSLKSSTAFNIATTLRQLGFLEQDAKSKRYRLGPRLIDLAINLASTLEINQASAGPLYRLAMESRFTARIVCWDQNAILVTMEAVPNTVGINLSPQIGPRGPAYCTAPGRAILAYIDSDKRRAYLESTDFRALTPKTICDPESLADELDKTRKRGYAVTRGEISQNLAGLAAPINDSQGKVSAAVSLGGEAKDLLGRRRKDLLRQLLAVAREISANMGYLPNTPAL